MIECNTGIFGIGFGFIFTIIVSYAFFRMQREKGDTALLIFLLLCIAGFFTICCLELPNLVCPLFKGNEPKSENGVIATTSLADNSINFAVTETETPFLFPTSTYTAIVYPTATEVFSPTDIPIIYPTNTKIIIPTVDYVTSTPIKTNTPSYPQSVESIGSGVFASAIVSDGMESDNQTNLNTYHYRITFLSGNPEGCGRAGYYSTYIWIGGLSGTTLTVNGKELGTLSQNTGSHGVLVRYSISKNDDLCALNVPSNMYHIVVGPDILYHYNSYCYRGNCN